MAETPLADAALSDDDFLALVDEVASPDRADARPDAPAPTAPDLADDESSDTSTGQAADGNATADGDEDRFETTGEQPGSAAPSAPAPAPTAPEPGVPFQYKAAGGVHTLPGARELPDGAVVIPKEARAEHLRRLASERELSANFRKTQGQYQRDLAAAKAARTAKDVEAEAVYKLFGDIKAMTPDERWDYFQKFDEEAPKLELEIQRRQLAEDRAALEAARRPPEPTPEEHKEARSALLTSELSKSYYAFAERLKAVPGGDLISTEEYNRVFQRWAKHPDRLVTVDGDQEMFDDTEIGDDLALLIEAKQRARAGMAPVHRAENGTFAAASAATGTTPAAARNAALNADRNPIPPTVSTGRVAKDGTKDKGQNTYKGKSKQFARDFMAGKLDASD